MSRHTTGVGTATGGTRVQVPIRRQDGTAGTAGPGWTGAAPPVPVPNVGYWSPLVATVAGVPELVLAEGDVIMVWSPTP